jgi:hypothetical protein
LRAATSSTTAAAARPLQGLSMWANIDSAIALRSRLAQSEAKRAVLPRHVSEKQSHTRKGDKKCAMGKTAEADFEEKTGVFP